MGGGYHQLMDELIKKLKGDPKHINLREKEMEELCLRSREQFMFEDTLLEIQAPVVMCGDIHGQFEDLLRMFDMNGWPPSKNYLFLGDYVDRGRRSLETICLLFAYKLKYKDSFFLLRGNHETASINLIYGFFEECNRRFSKRIWKLFNDAFNCMPFCALVEGRVFAMHGGLSQHLKSWDQLRRIQRPVDVPDTGVLCDLLWADPDRFVVGYFESSRGVSYVFGPNVVRKFCNEMDIDLIVRAHQVVERGYEFFAGQRLVTVFTAPNYCGDFGNDGAVLTVSESLTISIQALRPLGAVTTRSCSRP